MLLAQSMFTGHYPSAPAITHTDVPAPRPGALPHLLRPYGYRGQHRQSCTSCRTPTATIAAAPGLRLITWRSTATSRASTKTPHRAWVRRAAPNQLDFLSVGLRRRRASGTMMGCGGQRDATSDLAARGFTLRHPSGAERFTPFAFVAAHVTIEFLHPATTGQPFL
ncbi:MAG: hypothetical protein IPM07_26960 [Anaerolineales bacterium]|nr:hypothetical protein [Anaerolineales bacterium]